MSSAARVVAAVLTVAGAVRAQAGFEVVLWVDRAAERGEVFWSALRDFGFTAVSVSSGDDPALPGRHGLRFYCDQIAGKGVLELRDAQWKPVLDRFLATRDAAGLVRPACLADPETLDQLLGAVGRGLDAALPHQPWAVSLADEASATRRANPLDLCMSEAWRAAFRSWLADRHGGDVAALEARWGVGLGAFERVEPWTTDRIRARELQGSNLPRNLSPWSDQLEFTDHLFARAVQAAQDLVAQRAPQLGCGLTGIQPPSAFGGHDYARLLPSMTFYEVYDIVGARDLADALARPDALEFATLFPPGDERSLPMVDARLGSMVAHGLSGVIVWSAGHAFDDRGAATAYGRQIAAVTARLAPAAAVFAGARISRAPVWIVESQPSVRAHWMLDSWGDGATWPKRFSSWEAEHGTAGSARQSWSVLLSDLGLQADFVLAEDLAERLARTPPRLLILPACLALSDRAAEAVGGFVEGGGHALADHGLALYDDALRLRSEPALDELFGLAGRSKVRARHRVRNARGDDAARLSSGVAVAESGVRGVLGERVDGDPSTMVQIEARRGAGRTTFLNLAVCEYHRIRLMPERVAMARDLRGRVQRALDAADVVPPVLVSGEGLPTCVERIALIGRDGRRLLAVRLDAIDEPGLMRILGQRGARPVRLVFPAAVRVRDLVRGRELEAAADGVAEGRVFEAELGPWEPLLLEVRAW